MLFASGPGLSQTDWALTSTCHGHGTWIFSEVPHFKILHHCCSRGHSSIGQTMISTFSSEVWSLDSGDVGCYSNFSRSENFQVKVAPLSLEHLSSPARAVSYCCIRRRCCYALQGRYWGIDFYLKVNIWRLRNSSSAKSKKDKSHLPSKSRILSPKVKV